MTSLNLFATRFDQVLDFIQKRASENEYHSIFYSFFIFIVLF